MALVQDVREPSPSPEPRESSGWTEQLRPLDIAPMEGSNWTERTQPTTDSIRPPDSIRRRPQVPTEALGRTVLQSGTVTSKARVSPNTAVPGTGSRGTEAPLPADVIGSVQSLVSVWHSLRSAHDKMRQRHTSEFNAVSVEAARKVTKPPTIRYLMYGSACVIMDVWGIAISALNLTIILTIVTFFANIILMMFMWGFGRLLFGSRIKEMRKKREELEERLKKTQGDIQTLSAEFVRFRKYAQSALRRSPQLAAKATQVTRKLAWVTKKFAYAEEKATKIIAFFSKPGVTRSAEFIPFVQALPWWTIGVIAQYIVHRGEYKNAQRVLTGYQETKGDYLSMLENRYAVQVGTIEAALTSTSAVPANA